jgi:hypothetical protein
MLKSSAMAVSPASVKGDAISSGITPLRGAFDETLRLVMKLVMKRSTGDRRAEPRPFARTTDPQHRGTAAGTPG